MCPGLMFQTDTYSDHVVIHNSGLGVDDFTVSLDTQEVIVKGSIPFEDVSAKIAKTGKQVGVVVQPVLIDSY